MRHALAPNGEDPVGKVVVEGDRVPVVEAAIDTVVSQSLNRADFMGEHLLVKEATEKRGFRGI
jgi:hypothetical protein